MPTFTPPPVPEGADIMAHVWATRNAIQSWHAKGVRFESITLEEGLRYDLLTHPRLQYINHKMINSMWGMSMEFTELWNREPRTYTITYREA